MAVTVFMSILFAIVVPAATGGFVGARAAILGARL
jgi:hypothetical protein